MTGVEMNKPLVSILTPVYNVEEYLPKCLDSILGQTYPNLQVVLIDDGSKDNSWAVCKEYAAKDFRLEIYHQENQGVATTRNHLLEKVKGDYVLFVDSDDWIESDMVEYLLIKITESKADIVTCSMVVNDNSVNTTHISIELWNQDKAIKEFLKHISLNGSLWNKLVKTSLLHNLKFHCEISYGEDALFTWQVLQRVKQVLYTDKKLYHYRRNLSSLSRQAWTPEKKGSGHQVWETITADTEKIWPQYLEIAKARFALEDFWGLYYAALCGYRYDNHIRIRQANVRQNMSHIKNSKLESRAKVVTASLLCRCYSIGMILRLIKA